MLNPPHPGDFMRTEIIKGHGLTVTAAARVLDVSRPTLSTLLNAKADLSGDMALRIEKAFDRLLPQGFSARELRQHVAPLLGKSLSCRWGSSLTACVGCGCAA